MGTQEQENYHQIPEARSNLLFFETENSCTQTRLSAGNITIGRQEQYEIPRTPNERKTVVFVVRTSRYFGSCCILLYPAASCHIMPYTAVSCRICLILLYPAVSCRILRILPYHATSCRILPYPAISAVSCRILPYLPNPAVSCRILPYPAVSCRILPYPAVSNIRNRETLFHNQIPREGTGKPVRVYPWGHCPIAKRGSHAQKRASI